MQTLTLPFNIADYVLPAVVLVVLALGLVAKVPLFDSFVQGATRALRVVAGVFPYLAAVFVAVRLFEASGLSARVTDLLCPVLGAVGIPAEVAPLLLVKPLSGSGTLAVLEQMLDAYGADSYVGRCAAITAGCSETVLYVAAVYFGTVPNKRLRYGLPVAILATLVGAVLSCQICRLWY